MKCDELKWKWVYFPYLDAPEKQHESAVNAGYVKVLLKADVDAAIAELKQKLEDAKATAYAESVDAGMRERKLKRALWLSRAWGANQRTKYLDLFLTGRAHAIRKYKWIKITSKCRAKSEEYK